MFIFVVLGTSTLAPCQVLTAYESPEPYAPHPASPTHQAVLARQHRIPLRVLYRRLASCTRPPESIYTLPTPDLQPCSFIIGIFRGGKASWLRGPRGVGGSKYESRCWEETFSLEVADVGCLCRSFSCESQRRRSSRFVAITSGPVPGISPVWGGSPRVALGGDDPGTQARSGYACCFAPRHGVV